MRVAAAFALLFALPAMAGCLDADVGDALVGESALPPDAPLAAWLHDLSQPIDGLTTVTEHIRTPVPGPVEGQEIELDTWIIRPDIEEPVPVVLEVTPYYTGGEPTSRGRVGLELIERGYAVGVSSVRGTGNSGGCFTQAGPQEAKDTAEVIEHVAGLPWSSGDVGLIGVSYPGTTPQDVWVEAPPSLKTIVPISGISDMYRYNFVNGVPINPQGPAFNTYYYILEGPATFDPTDTETVPGAIAGEACTDQVDVQQGGASSGVDGNKDDYWQVRDFGAEYQADDRDVERASVFYIHGLQDWNVKTHNMEDWIDTLWDSGVPMKVWLGQWGHAWPASTGVENLCDYDHTRDRGSACRADWWNQTLVAWFDHFLKGIDTGIMDAPAVQVQDDDGRWRHEQRWPPADTEELTFYLDEGILTQDGPGNGAATYTLLPGGISVAGTVGRMTFVSGPLEEDITVSGLPRFVADVTPSGARSVLILSLGERLPNGQDRFVNHGALSLNHADDLSSGEPDVSGQTLAVDLDLFPQDDVLHAGNQVVLTFGAQTAGGPGPSLLPMHDVGDVTIDLSTAALVLPVDRSLVYESAQPYADWDEVQAD